MKLNNSLQEKEEELNQQKREEKWQFELKLLRNLLKKNSTWEPKLKLLPYMQNYEVISRFYLRKVLKLLTNRDENLRNRAKCLFDKKETALSDILKLLNEKPIQKELEAKTIAKPSVGSDSEEKNKKEAIFYTFTSKSDHKNKIGYVLFNGQKKIEFDNVHSLFDYLLKEKDKTIILFGWNTLNYPFLKPLLQESILRGFFPTVRGGKKIGSCFLKGNSILIKDAKKFHLEENEESKKIDKLYKIIQRLEKKTQNKYQLSLLNKDISTLSKIAWKDFWQTNEKEREQFGWERIWSLSKKEDEFVRQAYKGGYLDLFNEQDYRGIVSDWDFKNFYPSIMARFSYPVSRPEWVNHPQDYYGKSWKKDFYGFYECQVECLKDNVYPFFNHYDKDETPIYRPGKFQTILFSEEIKFFWKNTPKIKVEVGEGYAFRSRKPIFYNWIRKLYRSKEKGDQLAKIKMNSCYGMFARKKEQQYLIWTKQKSDDTILEFRTKDRKKIYLSLNPEIKSSWKFTNVGIAAAITSHSRITLFKALIANWNNLLYCATDGFVLKGKENKYKAKPIFGNCGELEKRGEHKRFISLAPNTYAFEDEKGRWIGKGSLKNLENKKFEFLLEKNIAEITEENKDKIWDEAPLRHEWGQELNRIIVETTEMKKKRLVNGKWEIWQEN